MYISDDTSIDSSSLSKSIARSGTEPVLKRRKYDRKKTTRKSVISTGKHSPFDLEI